MRNGPYELIVAPSKYPGKRYRGRYAYEHHVVFWRHHKIVPKAGEVVHHLNGHKRDNRISNLELLTVKQHMSEHANKVVFVNHNCSYCGTVHAVSKHTYVYKIKIGQLRFYCSRKCLYKMAGKVGIEPTPRR